MKIDKEFKELIPPLSEDERSQLEKNLLREGIRDKLIVWNGYLVDGHNRYEIAKKHGLVYEEEELAGVDSREDVILWIIRNQLGRRNLTAWDRTQLALRLKPMIAAKVKEKEKERKEGTLQNSAKSIDTREEIAKAAGVSHDTIAKVEKINKDGSEETKAAIANGDISIHEGYRRTIAELKAQVDGLQKQSERYREDCETLEKAYNELAEREPEKVEVVPPDYEKALKEAKLLKQINEDIGRNVDKLKKENAELRAHQQGKTLQEVAEQAKENEDELSRYFKTEAEERKAVDDIFELIKHIMKLPEDDIEMREVARCIIKHEPTSKAFFTERIKVCIQRLERLTENLETKATLKIVK